MEHVSGDKKMKLSLDTCKVIAAFRLALAIELGVLAAIISAHHLLLSLARVIAGNIEFVVWAIPIGLVSAHVFDIPNSLQPGIANESLSVASSKH